MGKSLCGAFAGTDPARVRVAPPEIGCSAATPSRCLYLGSQLPKSVLSLRRLVVNGTLAAAALAGTLPAALADPSLNLRRLLVRDASALSGTLPPHLALEELWLNASGAPDARRSPARCRRRCSARGSRGSQSRARR